MNMTSPMDQLTRGLVQQAQPMTAQRAQQMVPQQQQQWPSTAPQMSNPLAPSRAGMQQGAPPSALPIPSPQQSEWPGSSPGNGSGTMISQAPADAVPAQAAPPTKKWVIAAGVVGILAVALGGGVWYYKSHNKKRRR